MNGNNTTKYKIENISKRQKQHYKVGNTSKFFFFPEFSYALYLGLIDYMIYDDAYTELGTLNRIDRMQRRRTSYWPGNYILGI